MPENNPQRLSEIVSAFASEGANDAKWILTEHQLAQAKMSVQIAHATLDEIATVPENDNEAEIATDCRKIVRGMLLDVLEHYTIFLSYLSGTNVSVRMGKKEL
ncbi:MAG: hypothetical protein E3J21_08630 [Anaerolineales bacterium]|nr:MAG: hypothetical protein E3J21_08630 [Anaerolineales bacterium]